MGTWHKTGCICCAQNCGLRMEVEHNRIQKVLPDKDNPRSEGYACRKGLSVAHYQHHGDRLKTPLKRVGNGFEAVSWDQALDEIAEKLRSIIEEYGPRSLAYMGGGGQGCHLEAAFAVRLLRGLGSQYHYSALAQELTGMFWVHGRTFGRQYQVMIPDEMETDMLVAIGWNGWMSHQMPQARRRLKAIADDPDKLLVAIDPRKSELAERADIHLAIRPGTDALLTRAMIAIILQEGWEKADYLKQSTKDFERILPWFSDFDARSAVRVCQLDFDQVKEVCRLFASRKSSLHADLGTLMNRHSTVTSYLQIILLAICGRLGVRGGNLFPGYLMPMGAHSDERKPKTWRTVTTAFPAIMGTYPPNVMPEEIMSDHPQRLRAVLVSGANPLRSYADTTAYENAFAKLDLLVTVDVAFTETAALSHYVLPARSAYEKWDGTFFAWTYPEIFFQLRRPVVEPEGEPLEESEIYVRLADRLGLVPPIPQELYDAASGDRMQFGAALMAFGQSEPKAMPMMPYVLGKTLGQTLGSNNLAALWGLLQVAPSSFRTDAARAGFDPGFGMGNAIYQALMEHPEGVWIGRSSEADNLQALRTESRRIELFIPELEEELKSTTPESEEVALVADPSYPLILMAGRHMDENANTIMRDPEWNAGRPRPCALTMHASDARDLSLEDGQIVRVITEAGEETVELQITDACRPGHVSMPHGFGLVYQGKKWGANVNRLTKNTHRDGLAATPLHKFVRCRVEVA